MVSKIIAIHVVITIIFLRSLYGQDLLLDKITTGLADKKNKLLTDFFSPLKKVQLEDYPFELEKIQQEFNTYMVNKRKVCIGEFSEQILLKNTDPELLEKKLGPEEQALCWDELNFTQLEFYSSLFDYRKNYLVWLHERRLDLLDKERKNVLENIRESFYTGKKK